MLSWCRLLEAPTHATRVVQRVTKLLVTMAKEEKRLKLRLKPHEIDEYIQNLVKNQQHNSIPEPTTVMHNIIQAPVNGW